jgi:pimeloyl-ACP methyl ester carboxylesterase
MLSKGDKMESQPFVIDVPQPMLDDLQERLARTCWPDEVEDAGWDYGTNLAYVQALVAYWHTHFDGGSRKHAINMLPHFRAHVDGLGIHCIHARGHGPAPLPLLITHGWPRSFVEMLELILLLADPRGHGGDPADAFDVVVPSVHGFGCSDRSTRRVMTRSRVATLWVRLIDGLGHERFGAHSNDIGAVITGWMAVDCPDRLRAIHTLMPTFPSPVIGPDVQPFTEAEQVFAALQARWQQEEGSYNLL